MSKCRHIKLLKYTQNPFYYAVAKKDHNLKKNFEEVENPRTSFFFIIIWNISRYITYVHTFIQFNIHTEYRPSYLELNE